MEPEELSADAAAEANLCATVQESYSAIFAEPIIKPAPAVLAEPPMIPSLNAMPSAKTSEPVAPEPPEAPPRSLGPAAMAPMAAIIGIIGVLQEFQHRVLQALHNHKVNPEPILDEEPLPGGADQASP